MEIVSGLGEKASCRRVNSSGRFWREQLDRKAILLLLARTWNRSWLPTICLRFEAE